MMWRAGTVVLLMASVAMGQQGAPVVQPGAPGQLTTRLPAEMVGVAEGKPLKADVGFMRGMVMHHGQAGEMTALIPTHTTNLEVRELGKRISISQTDEMRYMKLWLEARGLAVSDASMDAPDMVGMDHSHMDMSMPMMPGMLTPAQMDALRKASGEEFDRLFLQGMIQHHTGALVMVKDLFNSPGAGQDSQLFNFATDVDNTQRAEIGIMQGLLKKEK
jgi:uncharacterized protein (DUF305 family)